MCDVKEKVSGGFFAIAGAAHNSGLISEEYCAKIWVLMIDRSSEQPELSTYGTRLIIIF